MADRLFNLFPTTLLHRHLADAEELNEQLGTLITYIREREANASMWTTTEGGFQSKEDLFTRNSPAILTLKDHIGRAVQDYIAIFVRQECIRQPTHIDVVMWAWAVSLAAGHTQSIHVHPSANISGVYYVAVPVAALDVEDNNGKIFFYDPRPRANMNQLPFQATRHRENPVPGDLILFPSWLEHSVSAFQGPGERISIAFNVKINLK